MRDPAGQAPEPAAWLWYVLAAQLRYLASWLTKGSALPGQIEPGLNGLNSVRGQFSLAVDTISQPTRGPL